LPVCGNSCHKRARGGVLWIRWQKLFLSGRANLGGFRERKLFLSRDASWGCARPHPGDSRCENKETFGGFRRGNTLARPAIRGADALEAPGFYDRSDNDPGIRHRREYGYLHHRQRGALAPAAARGAGQAREPLGDDSTIRQGLCLCSEPERLARAEQRFHGPDGLPVRRF
jgi:hypothetical protein